MKPLKWKTVCTTSHMKYGYVAQQLNGKWAWHFIGFDDNGKFPRPVVLKAKTLRGARTEAMRVFGKMLRDIIEALP